MIIRILFFLATLIMGIGILKYTLQWVGWVGKSSWAEDKIGVGGTYTMWKLIAIILIILGFLVLIGQVQLGPNMNHEVSIMKHETKKFRQGILHNS